jgi:hypothetical protein
LPLLFRQQTRDPQAEAQATSAFAEKWAMMSNMKSPVDERAFILDQPDKRPHGVRLSVRTASLRPLGVDGKLWLSLSTGALLTVDQAPLATSGAEDVHVFTLLAFRTPAEAEKAARRLVQSLLWMSACVDAPLAFVYETNEPATVFDRNALPAVTLKGHAEVGPPGKPVFSEIADTFAGTAEPDPALTLSMELFANSGLESSERARFLALLSALEPLAALQSYGAAVDKFVSETRGALAENPGISPEMKENVRGQLDSLRREPLGRAMRRVVAGLPAPADAVTIVSEAYELRNQIILSGRATDPAADLNATRRSLAGVVRSLYAARFARKLVTPI